MNPIILMGPLKTVNRHEEPSNLRFVSTLSAARHFGCMGNDNLAFRLNYYMNPGSLYRDVEASGGVGLCWVE